MTGPAVRLTADGGAGEATKLPTFLVIGAQKAATTSLWRYLSEHPDIFIPALKETHYFVGELNWGRGLAWYQSLYEGEESQNATHRGDVSTGYTMFPRFWGVPERIATTLGSEIRLIYLVREPISRMRSCWVQGRVDGNEWRPIDEALITDTRYLLPSLYALQVEQYLRCFDRDQLLVVRSEDLAGQPGRTLGRILDFLGLGPTWRPRNLDERYNRSSEKRVRRRGVGRAMRSLRRIGLGGTGVRLLQAAGPAATRRLTDAELRLDPGLKSALLRCIQPDLARLVDLVPDLEPWGLL